MDPKFFISCDEDLSDYKFYLIKNISSHKIFDFDELNHVKY